MTTQYDPVQALAEARHEFGEHGGVNMSIETSATFTVMRWTMMPQIFSGRRGPHSDPEQGGCYLYGRHFNPTVYVLGRELAALEGTEDAYCTASGMSAIAATLLQLVGHGDHVVASATLYGGTHALLTSYLPARTGLQTTRVNTADLDAVARAFTPRTRVLYVESIANPTLAVADIPALADIAHAHGAVLVVDNTFSPLVVSPARLGADVVVYSLTKFVNGAADLIAGAICGSTEFIKSLMDIQSGSLMLLGPTMDPRIATEISLRLPHLGLRMAEHGRRALTLAGRLSELGLQVTYPGLPDHPQHALLDRLRNPGYGYGGIFTLDLGTTQRAGQLMERLQNVHRFGYMAVSLGYFDTLMSCSGVSTSSELSPAEQARAGIPPGLIRVSVGYTGSLEQRWAQLESVLRELGHLG